MKAALLAELLAGQVDGRTLVVVTDLASGAQVLLDAAGAVLNGDRALASRCIDRARSAAAAEASVTVDAGGQRLFIHVFAPPARLIVVGAVHIAKPLLQMAKLTGYRSTLIDPRRTFAAQDGFAAATLIDAWPDDALAGLQLDGRCAIVTLTHDPKLDDVALQVALASPAFYIGALGSRRTQAARLARLADAGFAAADLARIRGPVGLAIGAVTPAEIAIAIMAEITQVRRQGGSVSGGGGAGKERGG